MATTREVWYEPTGRGTSALQAFSGRRARVRPGWQKGSKRFLAGAEAKSVCGQEDLQKACVHAHSFSRAPSVKTIFTLGSKV